MNPNPGTRYPRGGSSLWTEPTPGAALLDAEFFGAESVALVLSITPAAYTVTGSNVELTATGGAQALTLAITPASYTVTGSSATTRRALRALTTPAAYALTGSNATTVRALRTLTTPGSYTVTGSSATTVRALRSLTSPGSYAVTGSDAELTVGAGALSLVLEVAPASYAITGASAELTGPGVEPAPTVKTGGGGPAFRPKSKRHASPYRDLRETADELLSRDTLELSEVRGNVPEIHSPVEAAKSSPRRADSTPDILADIAAQAAAASVMGDAIRAVESQLRAAIEAKEMDEDEAIALILILAEA